MTREEKLDWLYRIKSEIFVYMPKEWLIPMTDALGDAIKVLEQEPTTKNDLGVDAISRADALALYCDKCGLHNCISKCSSYRAVEKMPPVTPQEPRKGHWIGIDEDPHEDWECDNCGFVIWADENIEKFHYCPNCGAKMESEVEDGNDNR